MKYVAAEILDEQAATVSSNPPPRHQRLKDKTLAKVFNFRSTYQRCSVRTCAFLNLYHLVVDIVTGGLRIIFEPGVMQSSATP